uniref:Uncharacterized protein n=1 Tax=viral metagenome TaxID=1070528 RepID=A0A6H2A2I6_9ZZZZ
MATALVILSDRHPREIVKEKCLSGQGVKEAVKILEEIEDKLQQITGIPWLPGDLVLELIEINADIYLAIRLIDKEFFK